MSEQPRHRRPALPGDAAFDRRVGDVDPATRAEAAERCASLLVRGARDAHDEAVLRRVVHLADDEGLDAIAELWASAPADSLSGALWRLYLLRAWVHADPVAAAHEFDLGRGHLPVAEVVAGVTVPPGPDEVRAMADTVLRGVVVGDFADTLFRAAAFAKVAAAGRARRDHGTASSYASDVSAARLMTMGQQLESAARLELHGELG